MRVDNLVAMANQIGQFFEAMPDRAEALAGISNHLRRFWAPRMRERLTAYWSEEGGTGLSPIVMEALRLHSIAAVAAPAHPARHDFDGASEA